LLAFSFLTADIRRPWRFRVLDSMTTRCSTLFCVTLLLCASVMAQTSQERSSSANAGTDLIATVQRQFPQPPDDSRIMVRWWWFGPSVTREEIAAEMLHMKEAGIGGFELQTVYPLSIDDPGRGLVNLRYLSSEFLALLRFTSERAQHLGLRM